MTHVTERVDQAIRERPADAPGAAAAPIGLVGPVVDHPRRRSPAITLALRAILPVAIFLLWWGLTGTGAISGTELASPSATWDAFVDLLLHQNLIGDIGISAERALFGLLIGGGLGLILGVIVGLFALGEEIFDSS